MRNLISKRVTGEGPARARSRSVAESTPASPAPTSLEDRAKLIDDAAVEAEKNILRAIGNHELFEPDLKQLMEDFREVSGNEAGHAY